MLLLILFICCSATMSAYAEKAIDNPVQLAAKVSLSEGTDSYYMSHKPVALVSHSTSRRTASTSYRHLTYSRFVDLFSAALYANQPPEHAGFHQPDVYFKPIALKLVFPEHYFW